MAVPPEENEFEKVKALYPGHIGSVKSISKMPLRKKCLEGLKLSKDLGRKTNYPNGVAP